MRTIGKSILAACIAMLGCLAVQAQNYNTAYGTGALASNTTGTDNSAFGANALNQNTSGVSNTACGGAALESNTSGGSNVAIGAAALLNNTTGGANIGIGFEPWNSMRPATLTSALARSRLRR